MERVADGVWLLRGDLRKSMNVYFIEQEGGGVIQFDAGTKAMTKQARAAAERLGGVERVVLGHADADHRGTAPSMGAPVHCHAGEVADAVVIVPTVDEKHITPHTEAFQAVVWHCLVSHPALQTQDTKW